MNLRTLRAHRRLFTTFKTPLLSCNIISCRCPQVSITTTKTYRVLLGVNDSSKQHGIISSSPQVVVVVLLLI